LVAVVVESEIVGWVVLAIVIQLAVREGLEVVLVARLEVAAWPWMLVLEGRALVVVVVRQMGRS
jgi:Kef-type K+ transport system membrane component KefB